MLVFPYISIVKLSLLLNVPPMNIFIVDDHPMTVDGYKNVICNSSETHSFTVAYDCKIAYTEIMNLKGRKHFDMAIIDKGIPEYTELKMHSGVDIAILLREVNPQCKIVMITAHTEFLVIYDIYKKIKPEGFISKGELTPSNLQAIIQVVQNNENYLSPLVKDCIKEIWKKDLMVDDYNRQILFYMSKGYKLKELEEVVFLATSTIQRRVIKMKQAFDVPDDSSLIKIAIKQGFI